MTLLLMGVVVEYLITMHVDKFGYIFLSKNASISQRTKHIHVFHHFISDYVKDKTVKIEFFRSEGNLPGPFTNNLSNGPF